MLYVNHISVHLGKKAYILPFPPLWQTVQLPPQWQFPLIPHYSKPSYVQVSRAIGFWRHRPAWPSGASPYLSKLIMAIPFPSKRIRVGTHMRLNSGQ